MRPSCGPSSCSTIRISRPAAALVADADRRRRIARTSCCCRCAGRPTAGCAPPAAPRRRAHRGSPRAVEGTLRRLRHHYASSAVSAHYRHHNTQSWRHDDLFPRLRFARAVASPSSPRRSRSAPLPALAQSPASDKPLRDDPAGRARLGRRHDHAHGEPGADQGAQRPAGRDREHARRRRHHRHAGDRQGRARRQHHRRRVEQPRDQPERVQEDAVRLDRGHHADHGRRHDTAGARRQSEQAAGEGRRRNWSRRSRPSRAPTTTRRRATARSCILPRRCSSTRQA